MQKEREYWLDRKENVTTVYRTAWGIGALLLLAELFLRRHEDFGFAAWFAFYAGFGFVACVALVLTAKALRRILKRSEDYYER
ncbi:MAG: hypothetical protein WBO23_10635 [Burkholderiales bacterium]